MMLDAERLARQSSRRRFLKASLAASAGAMVPILLPRSYLVSGQTRPPAPPTGVVVGGGRRFATTFSALENPLSETTWQNGQTDGVDWKDVRSNGLMAYGIQDGGSYDDSTAVVRGPWAGNHAAQATVRIVNPPTGRIAEVELRLRTAIVAHSLTGYEILFSCDPNNGYAQMVRWNGPLGSFTYLTSANAHAANGDTIKATVVGTVITVWKTINGVLTQVMQHDTASDSAPGGGGLARYSGGAPGVGFYCNGATLTDFGFSQFQAWEL